MDLQRIRKTVCRFTDLVLSRFIQACRRKAYAVALCIGNLWNVQHSAGETYRNVCFSGKIVVAILKKSRIDFSIGCKFGDDIRSKTGACLWNNPVKITADRKHMAILSTFIVPILKYRFKRPDVHVICLSETLFIWIDWKKRICHHLLELWRNFIPVIIWDFGEKEVFTV